MTSTVVNYWKRLWRWTTSGTLTKEELESVLIEEDVVNALKLGIESYKAAKLEEFTKLQVQQSSHTKLLNVVQSLQNYIDVDCFQIWEILKHYLCDISYGTPAKALQNVSFVDTRPSFLTPNLWRFYYAERLHMLKLLQYIIQNKNDKNHVYSELFTKLVSKIGIKSLSETLVNQFEKLLSSAPPAKKIEIEFSSDTVRNEWAESNLREQLAVLQSLLLLVSESGLDKDEFNKLFKLFRKHGFGKLQDYNDLLEDQHKEPCFKIMYMEICIFLVATDKNKIKNLPSWIEKTKETVEFELGKLQVNPEHSIMLLSWMMLTLQSAQHAKQFENRYHQYGATALRLKVFEHLHQLLRSSVFSDDSKCSQIATQRIFDLLNELCNKFDGDGTLSHQPGIIELCSYLLHKEEIAKQFWLLHSREDEFGVVSLWNTALEYFPFNFSALSILGWGLAHGGKNSVLNLLEEFKNLPVYSEIYKPAEVPLVITQAGDAIIRKDYFPLRNNTYHIKEGSIATVMERKEGTMIHFRTPYSYWTIFNNEIEKALDRQQHHQLNINETLQRVYEGARVLKGVLKALVHDKEIPKVLVGPSEGVFDVLVRFMRTEAPPLALLVECLEVCTALLPIFPTEIYHRLINTGLLPRVLNKQLSHIEYANGASFDSATIGSYLISIEQPSRSYKFLSAYIDMLCGFHEATTDDRITNDIILPGLVLILREVLPNVNGWRYTNSKERRDMLQKCAVFLTQILQHSKEKNESVTMLKKTCIYSLLHLENAFELLKIVSIGNEQLEKIIQNETNWTNGNGSQYLSTMQRCLALVMFALKLKNLVTPTNELTPLEQLIFTQNKQKDPLRVVPRITSYINHSFNKSLPVLCCRLLKRFADGFHMSLFASLEMSAYQVRVLFLERLRDQYETNELKVAILEFVATCVGKQPGLTEAFFMMSYENEKNKDENKVKKEEKDDESQEGILGYMADYLGTIKTDAKLLHSPLLACIMALFHELWKNNMQILVKKLRENPKFWEHMTSPLFSEIQPGLRTYAQIFNVLSIELFVSRGKIDANLKEMLNQFFDTNKSHLDTWIKYIFSFKGREEEDVVDKIPVWLSLLTSWKDFTTIFCKCLPISLNIAHKSKMVSPCLTALQNEIDDLKDGRLVVILAELYVIMLANWKDDCFDNRKGSAKQIDALLTNTAIVYECLHPRALRAILSIGTVAISTLDYEIKANSVTAQSIIRSVTNINSLELEKLLDDVKDGPKPVAKTDGSSNDEIPSIVLSLAMLEQCLDLYDDMFSGLSQWFESTRYVNKLLSCLQGCLASRRYWHTSLAALRCLTAYARGPFSKDLLLADVDQFLWMPLLPPKFDASAPDTAWKPQEWWKVYGYSLDFISTMVMKHGQFFASDAINFVGVHLEHLMEAILMPQQMFSIEALNICASTLHLIVQLVKFEARWRMQNINSLIGIMRSISACLYGCVTSLMRARRSSDAPPPDDAASPAPLAAPLHRMLEVLHMSTLCLLAFSPDLLSLLADPGLDLERWQPLVEIHFGAPKICPEPFPQLTFGTLLSAICLLSRSLNHCYSEEGWGARSPRRRRGGSSPGRAGRGDSLTSVSSVASLPALDERLLQPALQALVTLLAEQALLAVREPSVPPRHKQLVRRELASELATFHDFVRKRVLSGHTRPPLSRHKLGLWPLTPPDDELAMLQQAKKERDPVETGTDDGALPPPPPPKRASNDSMREYILRKHYLDKCARTPSKDPPLPVSHSTPASDKKKDASRSLKKVSWAETTHDSDETLDSLGEETEPVYSNLTDIQINSDEEYFHLMSIVFLYICQTDL